MNAAVVDALAKLVSAAALPVALVVVALLLRRPLERIVPTLVARIGSVSFHELRVDFLGTSNQVTQAAFELVTLSATGIAGSGPSSFAQIFDELGPVDFAVVDLGKGKSWLASRLLIFLFVLARLKRLRYCVFVRPGQQRAGMLLGVAEVDAVMSTLLKRYPWFQRPFADAVVDYSVAVDPTFAGWGTVKDIDDLKQPVYSQDGHFTPKVPAINALGQLFALIAKPRRLLASETSSIVATFISRLQQDICPSTVAPREWTGDVTSWSTHGKKVWEHSPLITSDVEVVKRLNLDPGRIVRTQGMSDAELARCVVSEGESDWCAITDTDGVFVGLADRAAMLRRLGQSQKSP